jgi:hypothetical protein
MTSKGNEMSRQATSDALSQIEMMRRELRAMLRACDDMQEVASEGVMWDFCGTVNQAYSEILTAQDTMRDLLQATS